MAVVRQRFIGTVRECFADFVKRNPSLEALELVRAFCKLPKLSAIQSWQRGDFFPEGEAAVRLICFLGLVGYEVKELSDINMLKRRLAWCVGLDILTPQGATELLKYPEQKYVWRIILHNGNYDSNKKKVTEFLSSEKTANRIQAAFNEQKDRISKLVVPPLVAQAESGQAPYDWEQIITAFGRNVAAAITLADMLLQHNQAEATRAATRGGRDLQELMERLQALHTTK